MPIETNTPVYFGEPTPEIQQSREGYTYFGCLPRNGAVYGLGSINTAASPSALNRPGIVKSTDGITFQQIGATYPAGIATAGSFISGWNDRGPAPNIITFVFSLTSAPAGALWLQDFDLDTETWSSAYGGTGGPQFADYSSNTEWSLIRRSDGSIVFIGAKRHTTFPFGFIGSYFFTCPAGGSWSAETLISAATQAPRNQSLAVDANDRVHFIMQGVFPSSSQEHFYWNIDSGGAVFGPSSAFIVNDGGHYLSRIYLGSDGLLHMMWGGPHGTGDGTKAFHAYSDTNLAAPAWTTEQILDVSDLDDPLVSTYVLGTGMAIYGNEIAGVHAVLAIYWESQQNAPFWDIFHLYKSERVGGVWTAPVEYYNGSDNLPPNWLARAPSQGPFFETVSFSDDAGRMSVAIGLDSAGDSFNQQAPLGFPFTPIPPPPPSSFTTRPEYRHRRNLAAG